MAQMHFYLFLRTIVSFLVIISLITSTLSKSLPRLRLGSQSPVIVRVGNNVRLTCPIYDDNTPDMLFIEWFNERNEPLIESPRIRITDSGALKIRSAIVDDSGLYICKGINGFGSETATIKLQILPEEDVQVVNYPLDNQYPVQYPSLRQEGEVNPGSVLKKTEIEPVRIIERAVGASINLDCHTKATRVRWTKNGRNINNVDLPHGSQRIRGVLNLTKVRVEDSGNYSCISMKSWPQVNKTFTLIVYDKPELTAFHPINTSVVLGERAVFHCKVRSDVKPFIQWLGSHNNVRDAEEAKSRGLIQINSQFYKVMKSTKIIETEDGNYYKDLIIEETKLNDSGNYICLAAYTNPGSFNFSFTYKSTYLTVLSPSQPTDPGVIGGLSISTYFWIICGIVSAIVGSLIWLLYRLQKKYENRVNSTTLNNNNIERVDNIVDKSQDMNQEYNHYHFGPEPSLTHSGYIVVNTNGDNSSSDRFTYLT